MKRGAREHDHSHQINHIAEAEGRADNQSDFVAGSLGADARKPELGGSNDGREVMLDILMWFLEYRDSAPLEP